VNRNLLSRQTLQKYVIPNLRNACRVLKLLSDKNEPASIRFVCTSLDLPRTSALRILSTLTNEGFCRKAFDRYTLGPALIPIGVSAKNVLDIIRLSKPYLKKITEKTGESCHLAIPSDDRSLVAEVNFSQHPLSSTRGAGTLVDLHSSSTGKCFLSFLHHDHLERVINLGQLDAKTKNTITSMQGLRDEIHKVREQGFAMDEQEFFEGVRCIAVPVFDADGICVAAIGVTASTIRFTKSRIPDFSKIVRQEADNLSAQLGFSGNSKLR